MNPFTTGIAAIKIFSEIGKFNSHGKEFKALYDAGDYATEQELIRKYQVETIENISNRIGLTYTIEGKENIPEHGPIMIYSNHQGFGDIFALIKAIPSLQIGYIAKDEWRKWKPIANAIMNTKSVFLIRNNPREAVKVIAEAKALLDKGYNLAIFPEGTRSRGGEMAEFKHGAYKFAQKAKVPILPVTIEGTYKAFEETGSFKKAHIYVKIHPLVHIEEMDKKGQEAAFVEIEQTVRDGLDYLRAKSAEDSNIAKEN